MFAFNPEGADVILVVEDDPQVARLIALVLTRNGFESELVSDGQAAMARAQKEKPQIIFADLSIKGMDGQALCSALKAQPDTKNIPFIVISGDRDIAEKARVCGADDYMGKPFEFEDLVRIINKYARTES